MAAGRSHAARSVSDSAPASAIDRPRKVTASASGRSPDPAQSTHRVELMKRSILSRIAWLADVVSTCCTWLRALRKVPW